MNVKEFLVNDFSMSADDFHNILLNFQFKFYNYIENSKDKNILAFFCFFNQEFNELKDIYEKINYLDIFKNKDNEDITIIFNSYENFARTIFTSEVFYTFIKNSTFQNQKEKKLKKDILHYFSYYGYHLDDKNELYKNFDDLEELEQKFEMNVYDFKMNNIIRFSEDDLVCFEKDKIEKLFIKKDGQYYFIVDNFSCSEFLSYCKNEEYRKKIFYLYQKSCSHYFPEYDNSYLMDDILKKRFNLASLNNKKSYFDLTHKKDDFINEPFIYKFLNSIKKEIRPRLKNEISTIREFIKKEFNIDNIKRENYSYFSNKYKEHLINHKKEDVAEYFFYMDDVISSLNDNILKSFNMRLKKNEDFSFNNKEYSFYSLYEDNILKTKLIVEFSDDYENSEYHYVLSYPSPFNETGLSLVSIYKKNGMLDLKDVKSLLHEIGHFIDFSISDGYKFLPYLLDDRLYNEFSSMFFEKFIYDKSFLFDCCRDSDDDFITEEDLDKVYITLNSQFLENISELLILSFFDFYIYDGFSGNLKELYDDIVDDVYPLGTFKESYLPNRDTFIFGYSSFNYASHLYTYLLADYYATFLYNSLNLENKNFYILKNILFKKYNIIEIDDFIKSSFKDNFNAKSYFDFYRIEN